MVLQVQRPLAGDFTFLLAYDPDRRHTSLIPVAGNLGQSILAVMAGEVVGFFPAEVGNLYGEGDAAIFVPDPEGSMIKVHVNARKP